MKVETYITIGVLVIVLIGTGAMFHDKWNEALQLEKQQVCEPWFPKGIATMLYREQCNETELIAIENFADDYCNDNDLFLLPCMGTKTGAKEYYETKYAFRDK